MGAKPFLAEDIRCPNNGPPFWHLTEDGWKAPVARPLLAEKVVYVRPGGSDANDGSTIPLAVATMRRAFELVPNHFEDRCWVIDCTGVTDTTVCADSLAAKVSSIGVSENLEFGGPFHRRAAHARGVGGERGVAVSDAKQPDPTTALAPWVTRR